jgi:predicted nucleic-acid-binding protein
LELEWVLRGVAGQPRAKVLACIAHLVDLPGVSVEDREQVLVAIESSRKGIDFADALHHAACTACDVLLTFDDRGYARRASRLRMKPSVKVPAG